MTDSLVIIDDPAPHVRRITLNRPEKRNALNHTLRGNLIDALQANDLDDDVRVSIVRGAGTSFSAGYDLGGGNEGLELPHFTAPGEGHWPRHVTETCLHFSRLPRWRGAAPVERAILAGDEMTGVDLMAVEEGLDTGGIYRRAELPIGQDDTLEVLRGRLVVEGIRLLVSALRDGIGEPVPQVGEPTYADKLSANDRRLDWSASAVDAHRRVRLGDAWTTHQGKRLKIWQARVPPVGDGPRVRAADGEVELVEVQPEGKGSMDAKAWANGVHWHNGDVLGT